MTAPGDREVTGCADCPLVVEGWDGDHCALDDEERPVSWSRQERLAGWDGPEPAPVFVNQGLLAEAPEWCLLRQGPVTLRLRREREGLLSVLDEARAELDARGTPIDGPALIAAITEDDER